MNKKKLIPLAALAAVVVLLAVLLFAVNGMEETEETGIGLTSLDAASVDAIRYTLEDGTEVALLKSDDTWQLESDPLLTIDQTKVDAIAADAAALTAVRELTDAPALSELGLEPAVQTFAMQAGEESFEFSLGTQNDITGDDYLKLGDTVYTVADDDVSGLFKTITSLYAAQSLSGEVTAGDVTAMQVDNGAAQFDFEKNGDDEWVLADDAGYALDQDAVNLMLNTACSLESTWTLTAPEDDAVYGLDAPNVTVTLTTEDGQCTIRLGGLSPEDTEICYAAATGLEGLVYEVDAANLDSYAVTKETLAAATPETAEEAASE